MHTSVLRAVIPPVLEEIIGMVLIKYVPLTIMAMADNCAPFIVMVLAFFILRETTTML